MLTLDEPRDQKPGRKVRRFIRRDVPICPVHGLPMRRYATKGKVRYFICKRSDCDETGKSVEREE